MKLSIPNRIIRIPVFWIAVLLIHIGYWGFQKYTKRIMLVDSYEYVNESINIKSDFNFYSGESGLPVDYKLYTKRPPFYPLFIALCYSLDIVILMQLICSVFSIYLIRKTLFLWGYNKKYDWLFLLLLILSPSQFIYPNMIMSETLLQLFLTAIVYFASLYFKEDQKNYYLYSISGLVLLSALTKPVMYPFIFLNFFAMLLWAFKMRRWKPFIMSTVPLFALMLLNYWNYSRTGNYQYSSIQTINLVDYNLFFFLVEQKGTAEASRIVNEVHSNANQLKTYSEQINYLENAASSVIREDLVRYVFFHLKGIVRFFIDPGRFDISGFFLPQDQSTEGFLEKLNSGGWSNALKFLFEKQSVAMLIFLLIIVIGNIVKCLGIILFALSKKISLQAKLILLTLVLYIACATGPLGASRFMVPVLLIYIGISLLYMSYHNLSFSVKEGFKKV